MKRSKRIKKIQKAVKHLDIAYECVNEVSWEDYDCHVNHADNLLAQAGAALDRYLDTELKDDE